MLLAASVFSGCSKPSDSTQLTSNEPAQPAPSSKSNGVIGVSLLTMANPFFKIMGDSMQSEGPKHGYEVVITSGEMDPARQKDQVNDFIVKKVSAIVLCPCDSRSIGTSIAEANKAGIPGFTADIASPYKSSQVVTHVAP